MRFLYDIGLRLFRFSIGLAAYFGNPKAKLWVSGRKIQKASALPMQNSIWFHCASLGEFEQAKPIIEACAINYPKHKILITFFSPSGYEHAQDYDLADQILYLPLDTNTNANAFVTRMDIKLACFVKYELWYHYLKALSNKNIPSLLISGTFRPKHRYFKWYGGFFRNMLHQLSHIFLQDEASATLLSEIELKNFSISGDTRFDRVRTIPLVDFSHQALNHFCSDERPVMIIGSSWQAEEELIKAHAHLQHEWKYIIAPHDISEGHLIKIEKLFKLSAQRLSNYIESDCRVLIIDSIGLLSRLYRYADLAFVGGGFSGALHNILEPAAYDIPVCFGPKHERFHEAQRLINDGRAFEIIDEKTLYKLTNSYNNILLEKNYIFNNSGATQKVMSYIKEEKLL